MWNLLFGLLGEALAVPYMLLASGLTAREMLNYGIGIGGGVDLL